MPERRAQSNRFLHRITYPGVDYLQPKKRIPLIPTASVSPYLQERVCVYSVAVCSHLDESCLVIASTDEVLKRASVSHGVWSVLVTLRRVCVDGARGHDHMIVDT